MKPFAITFVAVFLAVGAALLGYDRLIVIPRETANSATIQVNLQDAKVQAQGIADDLDRAVTASIGNAGDSMSMQVDEMQQRALAIDALARGSMFKTALAEYFLTNGQWPKNHAESGMAAPESYAGGGVEKISVGENGVIIIALNEKFDPEARIRLIPDANQQSYVINWRCTTEGSAALKRQLTACNQ